MAPDPDQRWPRDRLVGELETLGRSLPAGIDAHAVVTAVMARIAEEPAGSRARPRASAAWLGACVGWLRGRRQAAVAVLVGLLLALLLAPPVRAAVADWLGLGGVLIRSSDSPAVSSAPPPPTVDGSLTVEGTARLVDFTPLVPQALGTPDAVEVSADRRVLSMSWADGASASEGPVRLDAFDGRLSPVFAKTVFGVGSDGGDGGVLATWVGSAPALWFEEPHEVVVLGRDGNEHTQPPRLAGRTLVWERDGVTLRLEGDLDLDRAVEIGVSVQPRGQTSDS